MADTTEIKLLNVAKASHQELLEDYKDYLMHHGLTLWQKGDARYERTRKTCREHNDREFYAGIFSQCSDEVIANIAITLICQEDLMLRNLIEYHKQEFLQNGGIREEMTRGRIAYRNSHPEENRKPVSSNTRLSIKEQELNEREKRITQKELELARKEEELRIREKEIARLIRMGRDRRDRE